MRLLSLNVGLPRDVQWRDRTVHTAIFKAPVDGRRRVRRLNVDGDGQADLTAHGGEHRAVYVYDRSSYDHWARELGRDDLSRATSARTSPSRACPTTPSASATATASATPSSRSPSHG